MKIPWTLRIDHYMVLKTAPQLNRVHESSGDVMYIFQVYILYLSNKEEIKNPPAKGIPEK